MEITFSKSGEVYVAEFSVTGDFNLHIEGVTAGDVQVFQRGTTSGSYARVKSVNPYSYEKVYDYDFSAVVYPKYIKIVSEVEPTLAVVTSAGEVTEIKPAGKFRIKKYLFDSTGPVPEDAPVAELQIPKVGATWRDVVTAYPNDFYIDEVSSQEIVCWKSGSNVYAIAYNLSSNVTINPDTTLEAEHEYIAVFYM